jgi:hypothetical protein
MEKRPQPESDPIGRILLAVSVVLIIVFEIVAGVFRSLAVDSTNQTRVQTMYRLGGLEAIVRTCATPIRQFGISSGCRLEQRPEGMVIVFITSFSHRTAQTMSEGDFIMREIVQIHPELPLKGNANTAFPFFFSLSFFLI